MARVRDRERAINLRLQGWTYGAIKSELGISKSTLSDWLSRYPLTEEQLRLLTENKVKSREIAREKYIITQRNKREARLEAIYNLEKKRWSKLSRKELELAGLFLYWGEGGKSLKHPLSLNNTDPKMVKFTLFWLTKGLGIPKKNIKVYLHLYKDMDKEKMMQFWSTELKLPLSQFGKPYIKASNRIDISHKGFGYGTCGLYATDVRLKERVMMSIKAIADYYSDQI